MHELILPIVYVFSIIAIIPAIVMFVMVVTDHVETIPIAFGLAIVAWLVSMIGSIPIMIIVWLFMILLGMGH